MGFYPINALVPEEKRADRVLLRPLRATDVELDYDAVMSSAEMLRCWSQSAWPEADFTLAENLADLQRHEREHLAREAFTFTVLNPTGTRCLGCVYLTPLSSLELQVCEGAAFAAQVSFWVRASEIANDLDRHLLATLREWLQSEWAFKCFVFIVSPMNERQISLLTQAGLEKYSPFKLQGGRVCLAFR